VAGVFVPDPWGKLEAKEWGEKRIPLSEKLNLIPIGCVIYSITGMAGFTGNLAQVNESDRALVLDAPMAEVISQLVLMVECVRHIG
jgi:hypothetical protein